MDNFLLDGLESFLIINKKLLLKKTQNPVFSNGLRGNWAPRDSYTQAPCQNANPASDLCKVRLLAPYLKLSEST